MEVLFAAIEALYFLVSMAAWIWLAVRIWKSSAFGAILTFFLVLPVFYFLFKYWGDKERSVRAPFFINLCMGLLFLALAVSTPTFKSGGYLADWTSRPKVELVKSNPEMERWCSQNNNAVYSHDLGTCIEAEPGQKIGHVASDADIMDQLESHFYRNGLDTRYTEATEATPGTKGLNEVPDIYRVVQFEIKSKSLMPTIITVAECETKEACSALVERMERPDAPVSVASNGELLFMGINMFGDAEKMARAKQAFLSFQGG
jgi:hypothetical protein